MEEDPKPPDGVILRDPEDASQARQSIFDGVKRATERYVNGYEYGGVRLELEGLHYTDKEDYDLKEQKEYQMDDKTLARRLRGTVKLIDTETNKEIDRKKNITLARVPWLTERGTMIHNGSEYTPIMQSRLLPGVYARRRDNGEIEAHFNPRPGTGAAMRMSMDPNSGMFRLKVGTSDVHAYSLFKSIGVSDDELAKRWGREMLEVNKVRFDPKAVDRVYQRVVPKWERDPNLDQRGKALAVKQAMDRVQVAETVMRSNLPSLYSQEKAASMRMMGLAVAASARMEKSAGTIFAPDLTPEKVMSLFLAGDVEMPTQVKPASFKPDLDPSEMSHSYNSLYAGVGPRLASMKSWPDHWLDDQDGMGWLQWYENYHGGRRGPTDAHQIKRWKGFKARHGSQFRKDPTPRRAFALRNWAINPLNMLDEDQRVEFEKRMEDYRGKEYAKWYLRRDDFDDAKAQRLAALARERGATVSGSRPDAKELAQLVGSGHIKPEDLQ